MRNRSFLTNLILLASAMFVAIPQIRAQHEGEVIDKVVAVVGEHIVLLSDIENQVDQMTLNDVPVTDNSRCEIMEDLLYQKLFITRAIADSVTVTPEQIEQELNRRLRYFIQQIGSEEKLVQFYGKSIDQIKKDFEDDVEEILLIQMMQQQIVGEVRVSPLEVREFYASIPVDSLPYIDAQARISTIVRQPEISAEEERRLYDKLLEFKKRVEEGEDFGALCYLYSMDPGSAEQNGSLGWVDRNELVPAFSNAAIGLQPGEMSDVVKSEFGYHLIKLNDKRGDQILAQHLLLLPQVSPDDLRRERAFLDSLRKQIETVDTLTFAKAALVYSTDKNTRMNGGVMINPMDGTFYFDMETLGQIDRSLLFTIQSLEVGQMSAPELFQTMDGKRAYRLVLLEQMTKPHVANLNDDYNRLADNAKRRKENMALEQWIDANKNGAYIWIDPAYQTCPFQTKWNVATR